MKKNKFVRLEVIESGGFMQMLTMITNLKKTTGAVSIHLQQWINAEDDTSQFIVATTFDMRILKDVDMYNIQMNRELSGKASENMHALISDTQNVDLFMSAAKTAFHNNGQDANKSILIDVEIFPSEDVDDENASWAATISFVGVADVDIVACIPAWYVTVLEDFGTADEDQNTYYDDDDEGEVGWKSEKNPSYNFISRMHTPGNLEELEVVRAWMDNRNQHKELKGKTYMSPRRRKTTVDEPEKAPVAPAEEAQPEVVYDCLACQDTGLSSRNKPCPLCKDKRAAAGLPVATPAPAPAVEAPAPAPVVTEPVTGTEPEATSAEEPESPPTSKRRTKEQITADKLDKAVLLLEKNGYIIEPPSGDSPEEKLFVTAGNISDMAGLLHTYVQEFLDTVAAPVVDEEAIRKEIREEMMKKLLG